VTSEASTLSELIGDIYDAALDPSLWLQALERSCAFVGGSSAVLYWHDVASESSAALHCSTTTRTTRGSISRNTCQ
jgi:hypothetical protein